MSGKIDCCARYATKSRRFDFQPSRKTAFAQRRLIRIRADDVVRRRGYIDHFVTTCVYVSTIKRKPLIGIT